MSNAAYNVRRPLPLFFFCGGGGGEVYISTFSCILHFPFKHVKTSRIRVHIYGFSSKCNSSLSIYLPIRIYVRLSTQNVYRFTYTHRIRRADGGELNFTVNRSASSIKTVAGVDIRTVFSLVYIV